MKVLRIESETKPHQENPVGICNETDRLRDVVLWGPVGVEAALAQLYPQRVSLFYDDMDVMTARKEADEFARLLRNLDVRVALARDTLAALLPKKLLSRSAVVAALQAKARAIQKRYRSCKPGVAEHISALVDDDIRRYGDTAALTLNRLLCLEYALPLGNLIYARDQMNVLLGVRFSAAMAKPIRKPEAALYDLVYSSILGPEAASVPMPLGETFEGGDAYLHNGTLYVGVGIRTTLGAAKHIYQTLRPQLDARDLRFAIVQDEHPASRPQREQMDFMHLDTFSMPCGPDQIAVCEEEARRRHVKYLETARDGTVVLRPTGKNFLDHLRAVDRDVVIIPRKEQQAFGCNFLALDDHTMVLPLDGNTRTNERLRALGKQLILLDLFESTRGYGASHCMVGQLTRSNL